MDPEYKDPSDEDSKMGIQNFLDSHLDPRGMSHGVAISNGKCFLLPIAEVSATYTGRAKKSIPRGSKYPKQKHLAQTKTAIPYIYRSRVLII